MYPNITANHLVSSRTGVTVQLAFLLAFIALATLNIYAMCKVVNAALAQGQHWAEQRAGCQMAC